MAADPPAIKTVNGSPEVLSYSAANAVRIDFTSSVEQIILPSTNIPPKLIRFDPILQRDDGFVHVSEKNFGECQTYPLVRYDFTLYNTENVNVIGDGDFNAADGFKTKNTSVKIFAGVFFSVRIKYNELNPDSEVQRHENFFSGIDYGNNFHERGTCRGKFADNAE